MLVAVAHPPALLPGLLEKMPFLRLHHFFLELLDQFLLLLVGETSFYLELLQHHLILCLDALSLLQLFLLLVIG